MIIQNIYFDTTFTMTQKFRSLNQFTWNFSLLPKSSQSGLGLQHNQMLPNLKIIPYYALFSIQNQNTQKMDDVYKKKAFSRQPSFRYILQI